jgi:hypothetical protein
VRCRFHERRGHWGGVRARGGSDGYIRLALSRERRKLGGAHVVERGEGGGRLGRPEAKAQWGGRPTGGPGRKEVAQERRRGEQAGRRPRPRRVGRKPKMGPRSKRNSFRISIDFRIWQNFGNLHKEIQEEI